MYIPKHYEQKDREKLLDFMRAFPFAVMVSAAGEKPVGTHLPFVTEADEDTLFLYSHLSLANPQWKSVSNQQLLVIFSEPHAYISPSLYAHTKNVPTWNYIAVHAYGSVEWFHDDETKLHILQKQMASHEEAYLKQFSELPATYLQNLLKGIVAFRIRIEELQGKEKLSQNKTEQERQDIREHLLRSEDGSAREIGERM